MSTRSADDGAQNATHNIRGRTTQKRPDVRRTLAELFCYFLSYVRQYAAKLNGSVHILLHWYVKGEVRNEHKLQQSCVPFFFCSILCDSF
jgi:hypothetical protein